MFGFVACTRTATIFIVVALMQMNSTAALNISVSNDFFDPSKCSLICENNGVCQYLSGTIVELQNRMQSGLMIMKCQCTDGYIGMGCEQVRPICNLQSLTCPNGIACEIYPDSNPAQYHCDCSVADRISPTTARFCRSTYTEYCSSGVIEAAPVSFCTNGGKCRGDVISAQLAPFNTSVNAAYAHAGCICPPEYDGPHCEFMRLSAVASTQDSTNNSSASQAPTMEESATTEPTTSENDESSLEDLINSYSNQTTSANTNEASTDNDERRQILRVVMSSVFVSVAIIGLALAAMSYRHRRLKRRRLILLQKSLVPKENTNSYCSKYDQSPSITGSVSSASAASLSSVSATNRTIKAGTRSKFVDAELRTTSQAQSRYHSKKSKKSKGHRNHTPESIRTSSATDDGDIVSVSNELSFHRRCYPLTPFVVDDDEDDDVGEQRSEALSTGGLWNESHDRSSLQIQQIHASSMMNTTPFNAPKPTDHVQSWIVSLSNRAINFTEIIRQPGNHNNNHNNLIEPVLDEFNNTCNDIYLVDDDQDNDNAANDSPYVDKFEDRL